MKKTFKLSFLFMATIALSLSTLANRGARSGKTGSNKGKSEVSKSKDTAREAKTGHNSRTTREKSETSQLDQLINLSVEKELLNPSQAREMKNTLTEIKDHEVKTSIEKTISGLVKELKNLKDPSAEAKELMENISGFITSMKGLETQFKTSNKETQETKDALDALLQILPETLKWDVAKQKNIGQIMKKISEGRSDLQAALNKALEEAGITRAELIKRCRS